tara:strand:- start:25 stop:414 length:390 start_codon:yes stop_codon:yes gene_type:complete
MNHQEIKESEARLYLLANADWVCEVCGDYNSDCCAKNIDWKKGRCDVCMNEASVTTIRNFDCLQKGIMHASREHNRCCCLFEKEQEERDIEEAEKAEWEKPYHCDIQKYKEIQREKFKREYKKKHGIIN